MSTGSGSTRSSDYTVARCNSCTHQFCCTKMSPPLLLQSDIRKIERLGYKLDEISRTEERDGIRYTVLQKTKEGNCVFFDPSTRKCTIYNARPFDCFLFPFDIEKIDGKYWWIVYENKCGIETQKLNGMLDKIEKMPEFEELKMVLDAYVIAIDTELLKELQFTVVRRVRV